MAEVWLWEPSSPTVVGTSALIILVPLLIIRYLGRSGRFAEGRLEQMNCWFCNGTYPICLQFRNQWICPGCNQYNGFTKDGAYNKEMPQLFDELYNQTFGSLYTRTFRRKNSPARPCNASATVSNFEWDLDDDGDDGDHGEGVRDCACKGKFHSFSCGLEKTLQYKESRKKKDRGSVVNNPSPHSYQGHQYRDREDSEDQDQDQEDSIGMPNIAGDTGNMSERMYGKFDATNTRISEDNKDQDGTPYSVEKSKRRIEERGKSNHGTMMFFNDLSVPPPIHARICEACLEGQALKLEALAELELEYSECSDEDSDDEYGGADSSAAGDADGAHQLDPTQSSNSYNSYIRAINKRLFPSISGSSSKAELSSLARGEKKGVNTSTSSTVYFSFSSAASKTLASKAAVSAAALTATTALSPPAVRSRSVSPEVKDKTERKSSLSTSNTSSASSASVSASLSSSALLPSAALRTGGGQQSWQDAQRKKIENKYTLCLPCRAILAREVNHCDSILHTQCV